MRGRPRVHPIGTTNAERLALSRAKRKASGEAVARVLLSQRAADALDAIAAATGETSRAAVIERLAVEASNEKPAGPKPGG